MKFVINRVSGGLWNQTQPACEGAELVDVPDRPDLGKISMIELNTLEELVELSRKVGEELIVEAETQLLAFRPGLPRIRIYDDYL